MRGYLSGKGLPSYEKLVGILAATGASADYLVLGRDSSIDAARLAELVSLALELKLGHRMEGEPTIPAEHFREMANAVAELYELRGQQGQLFEVAELRRVIPPLFALPAPIDLSKAGHEIREQLGARARKRDSE